MERKIGSRNQGVPLIATEIAMFDCVKQIQWKRLLVRIIDRVRETARGLEIEVPL